MNVEDHIVGLENLLKGSDDTEDVKRETRMAMAKQAAEGMSPEDKKVARKAFDTPDDDKKDSMDKPEDDKKDSMDTPEEDKKDAKKSKKSKDAMDKDEDIKELKKQNASLTASVTFMQSKPTIDKMLTARLAAGMSQEEVSKFGKSLYGKSVDEINQRYSEDQKLFKKPLVASQPKVEIPFNGYDSALVGSDDSEQTLEELLA